MRKTIIPLKESILCAAIWYKEIPLLKDIKDVLPVNCNKGIVITGYRHGHCIWVVACLTGKRTVKNAIDGVGETVQGFLTNLNRFVNREEAAVIAFKAGQLCGFTQPPASLFSEDLY